jgi:hypothetical protein
MWRLVATVMVGGMLLSACGGGLNAEDEFARLAERHQSAMFAVTYEAVQVDPDTTRR